MLLAVPTGSTKAQATAKQDPQTHVDVSCVRGTRRSPSATSTALALAKQSLEHLLHQVRCVTRSYPMT